MASGGTGSPLWQERLVSMNVDEEIHALKGAYPSVNPYDIFRCFISQTLSELTGREAEDILPGVGWVNNPDKGDLSFPVPRLGIEGKNPADVCSDLAAKFPKNKLIQAPSTVGVNLRFDFQNDIIPHLVLSQVFEQGKDYGLNKSLGIAEDGTSRKRVVIEFSSPNIAKEFHIGHLRSTIIGAFLANLYQSVGWDVVRLNYLGDWGRQFGLLAAGWDRYGSEDAFQQDPLRHLFNVYTKINADFEPEQQAYKAAKEAKQDTSGLEKKGLLAISKSYVQRMESGEESALALWSKFRSVSIQKYTRSYARLNVYFDTYSGESEVKMGTMNEAEQVLKSRGVTEFDNDATIIDFEKHGQKKLGVAVVRNRNGTTSYLLRDVGAAIQRMREYKMDHMVYVVMAQQDIHLAQLFKILELMGGEYAELSARMQHVTFGRVRGMSTRKGNVQLLDDVLDDIGDSMHEVMRRNQAKYAQVPDPDTTADILGMTSLIVQDMSGKRINDYTFDIARMLSFEGDTGPYLQYAHARLSSVVRRAGYSGEQLAHANFSLLTEAHALKIVRLIGSWPDTLQHTYKTLEPATIVTYLFRLAHQVSSSYDHLSVLKAEGGEATSVARAALFEAARRTLGIGMKVLGLRPVDRM